MNNEVMFPSEQSNQPEAGYAGESESVSVVGKGFAVRAFAYIIDTIIISVIMPYFPGYLVGFGFGFILAVIGQDFPADTETSFFLDFVVAIVRVLAYFTIFEGLYGATPGKLITGMRVVKEDGRPCDIRTALLRGLWRFVDGIVFGAIAYSNMAPPLQQRLGDKKVHTLVLGRNDGLIQEPRDGLRFLLALVTALTIDSFILLIIFSIITW